MWRYAKIKGIVIKNLADKFWVDLGSKVVVCSSRGTLKKKQVFVGDKVEIDEKESVICKILPRTNCLIRPPVANIDNLIIVLAPIPEPDFYVVDKLLLFAFSNGITPVIVMNKTDLVSENIIEYISGAYQNVCQTLCVSAHSGYNINKLLEIMHGKVNAFAGQSAVGKSSLINALCPQASVQIGEVSKRIERGKNTTRHCEIFKLASDAYIMDTPGFSMLDECYLKVRYDELSSFYPDYVALAGGCKYSNSCNHIHEKVGECAVKAAVEQKLLDEDRYSRYKGFFESLERRWKNEHR